VVKTGQCLPVDYTPSAKRRGRSEATAAKNAAGGRGGRDPAVGADGKTDRPPYPISGGGQLSSRGQCSTYPYATAPIFRGSMAKAAEGMPRPAAVSPSGTS
jgi:hypothetical protein